MTPRTRTARPSTAASAAHASRHALTAAAGVAVTGFATLAMAFTALTAPAASAATTASAATATAAVASAGRLGTAGTQVNCMAAPSKCGYPDASNSGVPANTKLLSVPGQVSSGPGWHYVAASQYVAVNGNGAVLSGLYIPYNLDITASNVTVKNSRVVTSGYFAVSLRHTSGVTIQNSTIMGSNGTTGRAGVDITDIYGDSTGMVIKNNDISNFKTAVQVSTGMVTGNYIHNPGYISGDHTNGIFDTGSTQPLTVTGNTILNSFNQTDAISLDASQAGQVLANKTITNNLLAGGGYTIYGGNSLGNSSSHMLIQNNRFGQAYFAKSGLYGPVAYFTLSSTNLWSGNVWDSTGATIPAP